MKPGPLVLMIAALAAAAAAAQDQQQDTRPGWPCAAGVDPAYVEATEATGGRVIMQHPSELDAPGTAAVIMGAAGHHATITRIVGRLAEGVHDFEVPIDSTVESVNFFVSLQCLQAAAIADPSGGELPTGDPGIAEDYQFEAIRYVTMTRPVPGTWKVTVAGRGLLFLVVQAKSDLAISSLTFPEPGDTVEVRVIGAVGPLAFRLVDAVTRTLQTLTLAESGNGDSRRMFRGPIVPAARFRLLVTGVDGRGFRFQRVDARLVLGVR
jgi:hypothetical protein